MRSALILVFLFSVFVKASDATEAQAECVDCGKNELTQLKIAAEKIESELKNKTNICDSKGLIDTKRQAQINKWLPSKEADINPLEYLFRQTTSCIYGMGEGAIFAIGSLIKGIADLTSGAYNGGKDLIQYFKDNNASEMIKNLDLKKISENVKKTTGKTVSAITQSLSKMSDSIKKTYQEIGFQGTLSMIGFEMWQKSPHHVIKKFLKKAIDDVGQYLSKESQRFNCLDNESKAELMCKLISSVGTDVAIGAGISKLILVGKGAIATTKTHLLKNSSKVNVEEHVTNAAELITQKKSPQEVYEIVKGYKLPKDLTNSSSRLIGKMNAQDQQTMLKLLNTAQDSKSAASKQIHELVDSLSELPQKTLDEIDLSAILRESEQAMKMGQSQIIKDWTDIAKSDFKKGQLGCFSKVQK